MQAQSKASEAAKVNPRWGQVRGKTCCLKRQWKMYNKIIGQC